jgi:hypothetical protein
VPNQNIEKTRKLTREKFFEHLYQKSAVADRDEIMSTGDKQPTLIPSTIQGRVKARLKLL